MPERDAPGRPESLAQAVAATVAGDLDALASLLEREPQLVCARTADEHEATLLHHVAANGVRDEDQRTPPNAVQVCQLLLTRGAEVDALAGRARDPSQTALCLLCSSWPPFEAGLQPELVAALIEGGARVDGVADDGMPLATALVFGYPDAAAALVAAGARVDNLYLAAGVGAVGAVSEWFEAGRLRDGAAATYRSPFGVPGSTEPQAILNEALHFAVTHGRAEVAELLLDRGAEVHGAVAHHHCELPLVQALFVGEGGAIELLLDRGADPLRVDGKRGISALQLATERGYDQAVALFRARSGPAG